MIDNTKTRKTSNGMDKDVEELLSRGVAEIIGRKNLESRLLSREKLRVKLGIDPTSPNIHIGRAVQLWKLRAFQKLGHTAVFIIGDFTGIIGDTSDKDSERPMLTKEQIESNMKNYFNQAFKILDQNKTETRHNSEWLSKLGFLELGRMANLFGLHEFESREVIARRLKAGQRISSQELFYPLMQGYDSVAVKADVELGGTDQRYNLLAGRRIQPLYDQEPQDIIMMDLLEGTDGRKMSSSWGNVINITDKPNDMFGKVMSVKDELVARYFELCTEVPPEEIKEIMKSHPKDAKKRLAFEVTKIYHGKEMAEETEKSFTETFSEGGIPKNIETIKVTQGSKIAEVLLDQDIISSKTEWRRLVKEGAISNLETREQIKSPDETIFESITLKVGKHRFLRIEIF